MPCDPRVVAAMFVHLVRRFKDWKEVREIPPRDIVVLLELVQVAGFEATAVIPGRIDGSRISESWVINPDCRFKVLGMDGQDAYFATGWLNSMVRHTSFMKIDDPLARAIDRTLERIWQSQPLNPIQLTPEGDFLKELMPKHDQGMRDYLVDHLRDTSIIPSDRIGYHQFCNGVFSRHRVTATHDVLLCGKCHLRVCFPTTVNTYGELRSALREGN